MAVTLAPLTRTLAIAAACLVVASALAVPAGSAPVPQAAAGGADAPHADDAEDHGSREPVDLSLEAVGSTRQDWRLVVRGATTLPAPDAKLEVRSLDGRLGPGGGASAASWERRLALGAGASFQEEFGISRARDDRGSLLVSFEYDALPNYLLKRAYEVTIEKGSGSPEVRMRPITVTGASAADGGVVPIDAQPATPELEAVSAATADAGPSKRVAPGPRKAPSSADVTAAGATTVFGYLKFVAPDGAAYACRYCRIEVWDEDYGGTNDYLGAIDANYDGYFSFYVSDNTDTDQGGTRDIMLKFSTSTYRARVVDKDGNLYLLNTGLLYNNCPDGGCDLGTRTFTVGTDNALRFWTYRSMVTSYHEMYYNGPGYDIGQVLVRQPVDGWVHDGSTHASSTAHYHARQPTSTHKEIHLGSAETVVDTHYHEHGHYIMHKGYFWNWPESNCGSSHTIHLSTGNRSCGWTEGWADYWALEVPDDPVYQYSSGSLINLELWTCSPFGFSCGGDTGDTTEGRVAATLWDIRDVNNDGSEDVVRPLSYVWNSLYRGLSQHFEQYYANWKANLYSGEEFRKAASKNTINYPV